MNHLWYVMYIYTAFTISLLYVSLMNLFECSVATLSSSLVHCLPFSQSPSEAYMLCCLCLFITVSDLSLSLPLCLPDRILLEASMAMLFLPLFSLSHSLLEGYVAVFMCFCHFFTDCLSQVSV